MARRSNTAYITYREPEEGQEVVSAPVTEQVTLIGGDKKTGFWFCFDDEAQNVYLGGVQVYRWMRFEDDKPTGWGEVKIDCSGFTGKSADEMIAFQKQIVLATKIAADFENFLANADTWLQQASTL